MKNLLKLLLISAPLISATSFATPANISIGAQKPTPRVDTQHPTPRIDTQHPTPRPIPSKVYVQGKQLDPAIVNSFLKQIAKSPMGAQQLANPEFKRSILQSLGMQQAIMLKGTSLGLDKDPSFKSRMNMAMRQAKIMVYVQMMEDQIRNKPISQKVLKDKYAALAAANKSRLLYTAAHILVKDKATAKKIEKQLEKGADFATLAKKYSIDTGSKDAGGSLGRNVSADTFVPKFSKALEALHSGEYTKTPVKTRFGYHIIKLESVVTANQAAPMPRFAEVAPQFKLQLQEEQIKNLFDGIKTKYNIQVK